VCSGQVLQVRVIRRRIAPRAREQGDGLAGEALEHREPALVISERERRAVAIAAGARRAGWLVSCSPKVSVHLTRGLPAQATLTSVPKTG
jgi:hypothetical protein